MVDGGSAIPAFKALEGEVSKEPSGAAVVARVASLLAMMNETGSVGSQIVGFLLERARLWESRRGWCFREKEYQKSCGRSMLTRTLIGASAKTKTLPCVQALT